MHYNEFRVDAKARRPRLLAVLIDADNVPAKYAEGIMNKIAELGDPVLRRVYGDWANPVLSPWREKTRQLGLVERQQMTHVHGKNASDIGLVIDGMDLLYSKRYDGFVLVSSDSDFTQLASRFREDGRVVYGIGEARTPNSMRAVCTEFHLIENLTGCAQWEPQPLENALHFILAAMQKIQPASDDGWYLLANVGSKLRSVAPKFNPRAYGASKLQELVHEIPNLQLDRRNNHPVIRYSGSPITNPQTKHQNRDSVRKNT